MKRAIAIGLLGTSLAVCGAAFSLGDTTTAGPIDPPKSSAALGAIRKFERAKAAADAIYRRAMKSALTEEVATLEQARQVAMKNDQLPEALRIDAAKKVAQDASAGDKLPAVAVAFDTAVFSNTWRMPENGALIRYSADGTYQCDRWSAGQIGHWKALDADSFILHEPDGTVIKSTFTADRKAAVFEFLEGSRAGAATAILAMKPPR